MRRSLAVSLLAAALLAACGSGSSSRKAVVGYISEVNRMQSHLQESVTRANLAYSRFVRGAKLSGAERAGVLDAVTETFAARRSLERLRPPPEAQRLHTILVRLLDGELKLSLEVELLVNYLPAAGRVLSGLRAANAQANQELAASHVSATQAAALRRYARRVRAVRRELVALGRPPTLEPWQRSQVDRLRRLEGDAEQLAAALLAGKRVAIQQRLAEFSRVAGRGAPVTAAQQRAVRSYDRQVHDVEGLMARAERENARLQQRFR